MHIEDKETGRWSFVFKITRPEPFVGSTFYGENTTSYYNIDWKTLALAEVIPQSFIPMQEWLAARTSAYRFNTVSVKVITHTNYYPEHWSYSVLVIEVPSEFAVLFKMFWC
jgi:hypothetical protein